MESDIVDYLHELADYTIKKLNEGLKTGRIQRIKVKRDVTKAIDFNYDTVNGFSQFATEQTTVEEETFDVKTTNELPTKVKMSFGKATSLKNSLVEISGENSEVVERWILQFIQALMKASKRKTPSDSEITYMITKMLKEIEGEAIEWSLKVFLTGVIMIATSLKIGRGTLIRRTNANDLWDPDTHYDLDMVYPPSAILELSRISVPKPMIFPEINQIILALQLYEPSSIYVKRVVWKPQSIVKWGEHMSYSTLWPQISNVNCRLSDNDEPYIMALLKWVIDKLPINKLGIPEMDNPIGIAIARYQDSIQKPEALENRIGYAVMGLEALYLKGGEQSELSHRLAQRVAKVSSIFGSVGTDIYGDMKSAYRIRSNFVHGVPHKAGERTSDDFAKSVIELLRSSILFHLFIKHVRGEDKDSLISLIDNSLISSSDEQRLRRLAAIDNNELLCVIAGSHLKRIN